MLLARRIKHMNQAVHTLKVLLQYWKAAGDVIPEVDWSGKMKSLEFQETLRARNELVARLPSYGCTLCKDFEQHVSHLVLALYNTSF